MKKIILLSAVALWMLAIGGCEKQKDNNEVYPNVKIIKELPIMYGSITKSGDILLIQSQKELNNLFKDKFPVVYDIYIKKMPDIDFNKHTLIIGSAGKGNDVHKLKYKLKKIMYKKYKYNVEVFYSGLLVGVGPFIHGIVIDKIPNSSDIELEIINSNS